MKPELALCTAGIRQKASLFHENTVYFWQDNKFTSLDITPLKITDHNIQDLNPEDGRSSSIFAINSSSLLLISRYNVKLLNLTDSICSKIYDFNSGEFSRFSSFDKDKLYIANNKREILIFEDFSQQSIKPTVLKVPGEPDWTNDLNSLAIDSRNIYFSTDDGTIGYFKIDPIFVKKPKVQRFRDLHINCSNHSYLYSQQVTVYPSNVAKFGDDVYKFSIDQDSDEIIVLETFRHPRRNLSVNSCSSSENFLAIQFSGKFISLVAVYDIKNNQCLSVLEENCTINNICCKNRFLTVSTTDARLSLWSIEKKSQEDASFLIQFHSDLKIAVDKEYHIPGQSLAPVPVKDLSSSLEFNWTDCEKPSKNVDDSAEDDLPEEVLCPITQEIMIEPVLAKDQRIYEKTAIEIWLNKHGTSPFTREKMHLNDIIQLPQENPISILLKKYNGSQSSSRYKQKPKTVLF